MRFVQVMFDGKDFLGETNNTHKDEFIILHHPVAMVKGGTILVAFETLPDIIPGPLVFPTMACITFDIKREGVTRERYLEALNSLPPSPVGDRRILEPKIITRMN